MLLISITMRLQNATRLVLYICFWKDSQYTPNMNCIDTVILLFLSKQILAQSFYPFNSSWGYKQEAKYGGCV